MRLATNHVKTISGMDHNGVKVQASEYPENILTNVIIFSSIIHTLYNNFNK